MIFLDMMKFDSTLDCGFLGPRREERRERYETRGEVGGEDDGCVDCRENLAKRVGMAFGGRSSVLRT